MADRTEQQRLDAMIEEFERQQPELSTFLAETPVLPWPAAPVVGYKVSVRSGTTTKPTGIAFVDSGTSRTR